MIVRAVLLLLMSVGPCASVGAYDAQNAWPPLRLSELQQHWSALLIAPLDDPIAQHRALDVLTKTAAKGPHRAQQRNLQTLSRLRLLRPLPAQLDALVVPALAVQGQRLWARAPDDSARAQVRASIDRLTQTPLFEYATTSATPAAAFDVEQVRAPTLLHFWARWCAPCLSELPELVQFHAAGASGLDLVTINHDPQGVSNMRLPNIQTLEDPDFTFYRRISGRNAVALPATYLVRPGREPLLIGMGRIDWRSPALRSHLAQITRSNPRSNL